MAIREYLRRAVVAVVGISLAVGMIVSPAFKASATLYYNSGGPGNVTYVQDPSIEGGFDAFGVTFSVPVTNIQFGLAELANLPLSGATVTLSDNSVHSFDLPLVDPFPEGQFNWSGSAAVTGFTLQPAPGGLLLAFDNLTVASPTLTSVTLRMDEVPFQRIDGLTVSKGGESFTFSDPGSATGDPHFTTYTGIQYDYQGVGDFLLTRSTADQFNVQVRTRSFYDGAPVTIMSEAAATLCNHIVSFDIDRASAGENLVWLDGSPMPLSSATPNLTVGACGIL